MSAGPGGLNEIIVGAPTFEELPAQIAPIVKAHPEYQKWWAQQVSDRWWVASCVPEAPRPRPADKTRAKSRRRNARTAAPATPYRASVRESGPSVLDLLARVRRLEQQVEELTAERRAEASLDRDFHEFMDGIGWTERMELLS